MVSSLHPDVIDPKIQKLFESEIEATSQKQPEKVSSLNLANEQRSQAEEERKMAPVEALKSEAGDELSEQTTQRKMEHDGFDSSRVLLQHFREVGSGEPPRGTSLRLPKQSAAVLGSGERRPHQGSFVQEISRTVTKRAKFLLSKDLTTRELVQKPLDPDEIAHAKNKIKELHPMQNQPVNNILPFLNVIQKVKNKLKNENKQDLKELKSIKSQLTQQLKKQTTNSSGTAPSLPRADTLEAGETGEELQLKEPGRLQQAPSFRNLAQVILQKSLAVEMKTTKSFLEKNKKKIQIPDALRKKLESQERNLNQILEQHGVKYEGTDLIEDSTGLYDRERKKDLKNADPRFNKGQFIDPFHKYGFGVVAFFSILRLIMLGFAGITILFIPVFICYSQGTQFEFQLLSLSSLSLGNIGQVKPTCIHQLIDLEKPQTFKCRQGHMTDL